MIKNNIFRLAKAKINLYLLICGRRDEYHLLDSLVVFADYGDEVSVSPAEDFNLRITGPFADSLIGEKNNIILTVARMLRRRFDISCGADIHLVKRVPVSAGIGGGSADAAATVHALAELWNISDKIAQLDDLVGAVGADLPVCMAGKTTRMQGTGEILHPVTIEFPLYILLVNPGVSVATKDIFSAWSQRGADFSPTQKIPDRITTLPHLRDILSAAGNDLLDVACEAAPEIRKLLAMVAMTDQCVVTGMSGSGATCFGLFASAGAADRAAKDIARDCPHWWIQSVRVP